MAINPGIGDRGGQNYNIVRAFNTFLGQMAEGGIGIAAAVIKELLQNADDAGATEVSVILDERVPPANLPADYRPLLVPAIVVRNNSKFRLKEEVAENETDDFTAICDVGIGHKRAQATAAGRFGIGFNSVYFLSDTPILFSRREVHVFDLLHRVFEANGWRFPLDEFPATSGSLAGSAKGVVEWLFPKATLGTYSFESVANSTDGDFKEAVVRLPLRNTPDGDSSLHSDQFRDETERERILHEMAEQAAKAILFLKNVRRVTFGKLTKDGVEPLHDVTASEPPADFGLFLKSVKTQAETGTAIKLACQFERKVIWRDARKSDPVEWNFWVRHVADFSDDGLRKLRDRLKINGERAIPWGAIAFPMDAASVKHEGEIPAWRVFLPLREPGPSACVFCGAFFVGPSRQHPEFRVVGSDEALRKTDWNKTLVDRVLVPMLVDSSIDIPERVPNLISEHPKLYLSLFPRSPNGAGSDATLAEYFRQRFAEQPWTLRLFDIWDNRANPVEWLVGDEDASPTIEMTPEWLLKYRDRFAPLSNSQRRFVKLSVGEALRERVAKNSQGKIRREVAGDVARAILINDIPPEAVDLKVLLERLAMPTGMDSEALDGLWAFASADNGKARRYSKQYLYIFDDGERDAPIHQSLRQLGLNFEHTEWVKQEAGLPMISVERRRKILNLFCADNDGALLLLSRVHNAKHDFISQSRLVTPIIDFLVTVSAIPLVAGGLKLAFLVQTANNKTQRRKFGVVLLKPESPSDDEVAVWEGLFRRTLAEVDPECARNLNRLLKHQPEIIHNLSDDECDLMTATCGNWLSILNGARSHCSEFVETLRTELNHPNAIAAHSDQIRRGTAAVIREAVLNWERMPQEQQETVLTLPIHRTSSGDYVSLIGDRSTLPERFRIQSNDNISDAPVALSDCCLLDSAEPSAKRLYREFLRLDEHGRIAVLKDVLRQVGSARDRNVSMLDYLDRYLHEGMKRLAESTDAAERKDFIDLKNLADASKSVPCIDDEWRTASVCRAGWALVEQLELQGWKRSDMKSLLPKLFPEVAIATVDDKHRKLLERVHPELNGLEPREIANRAVTSNSEGLDLVARLKLLFDNRKDLREGRQPATCVSHYKVSTISGSDHAVSQALIRSARKNDPSSGLLKLLAPETVDLAALASQIGKRFNLQSDKQETLRRQLPEMLAILGVPKLDEQGIRQRIANNFGMLWPKLDDGQRLELLECVKTHELTDDLKAVATTLPTVRVSGPPGSTSKWISPAAVIGPSWMKTKPPYVYPGMCTAIDNTSDSVRQVWDSWCAINCFELVAIRVVESAAKTTPAAQSQAASQVYQWLDRVHGSKLAEHDEFIRTLRGLPWVLASRSGTTGFQRPSDILIHAGEAILSREFWVKLADTPLPECCSKHDSQKELGFLNEFAPSADIIHKIAKCLEHSANADRVATIAVYRALGNLIEESDDLKSCWRGVANERPVFRLFRDVNDRVVPALSVFVSNEKNCQDFGEVLYCLRAVKHQPQVAIIYSLFRKLQVLDQPDPEQLLTALSKLKGQVESHRSTYHSLIDTLLKCWKEATGIQAQTTRQMCVATCAGNFRPLSECYWDEILSDSKKVDQGSRHRMIDGTDAKTRLVVNHLLAHSSDAVHQLSVIATAVLSPEPQQVAESAAMRELMEPWRTWFVEIAKPDSILHDDAKNYGLVIPSSSADLVAVERIPVCYQLPDGEIIRASADWPGPVAFGLDGERVFVRADCLTDDLVTDFRRLESVDCEIREQVARLFSIGQTQPNPTREKALTFIKETVERPSVVLERLHETAKDTYFYQYKDQAADPEFAKLHDEYARTRKGSKRREELTAKLSAIVTKKFVTMRREQIRAYGYDEFSVFAELVQNAEDAYTQRQQLGLDNPPNWSVAFRFQKENENTTLSVEHYGRSFNCWRHGNQKVEAFRKDVEGVLRSSGSFKPYGPDASDSRVIGRFGLGFKSVYLLTDCPSIFSGGWNFRIEGGCLPVVVARPNDLVIEATRISLPLLDPDRELRDAGDQLALCLLPFLRQTKQISIAHSDTRAADATTRTVEELGRPLSKGPVVELVTIEVSDDGTSRNVRIIRVRSTNHSGQLAMFLASDDLPASWSDGFTRTSGYGQSSTCDFYSALPLKSELGCGVAVSHRFDVQSGRTHLVDSKENRKRAEQIADLLAGLSTSIQMTGNQKPVSERLIRFWSVWRWDRGDAETKLFRECLAKQLMHLSRQNQIVPTLDGAKAVSLHEQPLFFFSGIPQPVIDALVDAGFPIDTDGGLSTALTKGNILAPGFVRAYRRLSQFTQIQSKEWVDVVWEVIGTTCKKSPWLATHPKILNSIADSASEEARDEIRGWLAESPIKALGGKGKIACAIPSELLLNTDDVQTYLPVRFLKFVDSPAYSQSSLDLLKMAGLSDLPSSKTVLTIISTQDLKTVEAVGMLRFLQKEKRWRKYDGIQQQFQKAWFPAPQRRITVAGAVNVSLIDSTALCDAEFKAWLGIGNAPPAPPPRQMPTIDARRILLDLHSWWGKNGVEWEREYERRTYAFGKAPKLSCNPKLDDLPQRKDWLSLMLLGVCHTIGRTKAEQHKGFLQICHQSNWLDTFAARESSAVEWFDLLESYLDRPRSEIKYYQWAKLFVPIFHLSRWLDDYVTQARSMNRKERFTLNQIFAPRLDARAGGGGRDAPSSNSALGIGACFVARELCRLGVVSSEFAHEHCYVPSARIRNLIDTIAGTPQFADNEPTPQRSVRIFQFLSKTFGERGEELARFRISGSVSTDRCGFDLPLIALCEDDDLRQKLLGRDVIISDELDGSFSQGVADEGWRTLSDGRRIKLNR